MILCIDKKLYFMFHHKITQLLELFSFDWLCYPFHKFRIATDVIEYTFLGVYETEVIIQVGAVLFLAVVGYDVDGNELPVLG